MLDSNSKKYVRRTTKDYPMSFKLAVVGEVERGEIGFCAACRKYGIQSETTLRRWLSKFSIFDHYNQTGISMRKTPAQRIKELEETVRILKRQNDFLEVELEKAEDKAGVLDKLITIVDREHHMDLRKKLSPEQSKSTAKKKANP